MTRPEILDTAKKCVCGDREQDYGSPENNFSTIAQLWEPYLKQKCVSLGADVCVNPEDVAVLLSLVKIGRIASGRGKLDNWVGLAGYAACGGEVESKPDNTTSDKPEPWTVEETTRKKIYFVVIYIAMSALSIIVYLLMMDHPAALIGAKPTQPKHARLWTNGRQNMIDDECRNCINGDGCFDFIVTRAKDCEFFKPENEWISVKDEPCPLWGEFIASDGINVEQCYISTSGVSISRKMLNWDEVCVGKTVTHWQPLPEPPTEQ